MDADKFVPQQAGKPYEALPNFRVFSQSPVPNPQTTARHSSLTNEYVWWGTPKRDLLNS